jgi:1-acyl-sn-glycerol-3-phosphate acyltransferase
MGVYSFIIAARALLFVPLVTALGSILAVAFSYFDRKGRFIHRAIVRPWSFIILWLAGARVVVKGIENVPSGDQGCIIVMNHQSHLDIPLIVRAIPMQIRFIAKIELRRVPIFGSAVLRMGHIYINRKNHFQAMEGLRSAGESMKDKGFSLVFAPEGTRSPDGSLLPFKKGAFVTAIETGLPILPVTIDGTGDRLPKGSLRARRGPVTVTIHHLIPASGLTYEDRDQLSDKVRLIIEKPLESRGMEA